MIGRMDLEQGGTVMTISPLYSTGYAGVEWLFYLRSDCDMTRTKVRPSLAKFKELAKTANCECQ